MTDAPATYRPSPQQRRLLARQGDGPVWRSHAVATVPADLTDDDVRTAVEQVVATHESLRTTFVRQAGLRGLLQAVHDELAPSWSTRTLATTLDTPGGAAALAALAAEEAAAPADLAAGPPVTAVLATDASGARALVLSVWSLAADPASVAEVAAQVLAGPADDPLAYADFAEYADTALTSDEPEAVAARDRWTAAATVASPTVPFPGPAAATTIDGAPVRALAERLGASPLAVGAAAWGVVLQRLTGVTDLAVPVLLDGRHRDDLIGAVGLFSTAVPIVVPSSIDGTDDPSFAAVVASVAAALASAEADLDSWSPESRGAGSWPTLVRGPGLGRVEDAAVDVTCGPDGVTVTHADVARSLGALLASAATDPTIPVSALALLDDEALDGLRALLSGPVSEAPPATLTELFEEQVDRTPDRPAVALGADRASYRELDERANRIAHLLGARGITKGDVVGVCVERGPSLLAAILGILKAGAAYLPLSYDHPAARLGHQLADSGARLVITLEALLPRLPEADTLCLDRDAADLEAHPTSRPGGGASPDDPVYILYTSGSTGAPKGVVVTHANLVNYCRSLIDRLGLAQGDGLHSAAVTSIATDLGNTCVFPPILAGGCTHLVDTDTVMDPLVYAAYSREHGIDVLKVTPSHLVALLTAGADVLPRRVLVVGGEALSWDLVERARSLGSCRVLNHYGPTETTVGCCVLDVDAEGAVVAAWQPGTVPIGHPLDNGTATLADAHGRPVPVGVAGELWIGGAGVSRGYLQRPDDTALRFADDPLRPGRRAYRTGDLARALPGGAIEFLGRVDDQVKIRGYRVEPKEIEHVLAGHPAVRQVAVVAREDQPGERRLVAYLVADGNPTAEALRATVLEQLPDHMAPAGYVVLDRLPLTASGKLDRQALPAPDLSGEMSRPFVAPRDDLEATMAAVWTDVLGVDRVGVHDDFFELGGHSLLAVQIVARVRESLGVELPLHSLFMAPTVALLADEVRVQGGGEPVDADVAELLDELEGLSDEEIARMLAEGDE